MYAIFHPLDVEEPLPRELIHQGWRERMCEIHLLELTAALYLPALIMAMIALGSAHVNALLGFVVMSSLFAGFLIYALSARYR
jgi:hypothetical protein